ncbi:type 4a pilus biogenesis protein PilO [Clostridium intestinale]|uniref:Pilus assembly protein, PilO n=1 Tax=Clostridium intestinale DSM 6191 TaxID=1121320 RepID=A0A1M6F0C8_9CLOT|nr:type 4a pilus biogenesis protein PilO [Clostridium intestinale]SHI91194.1 Pilus assembly protein, PilO [Clostridium intestinale DSM 6191]
MKKIDLGLNKLSHKEKILLLIVAIMSVFFVYYNYLIIPTMDKLAPLETEVETLRNKTLNYENIENKIIIKEKEYNELKDKYNESARVLPKIDKYPELSKELNDLANKNTVTLQSIAMEKGQVYQQGDTSKDASTPSTSNKGGLSTQKVTLSLKGDFSNILNLVNDLENGSRICEINSITSTKESSTINLTFYYAPGDMEENYDFNSGSYGKDNMFN